MDPHFDGVIFKTHAAEVRRRIGRNFPPYCVVDVRPRADWEQGHIPGAVSEKDRGSALPAGTTEKTELIIVGAAPEDPAMRVASLELRRLGAHRIVELTGGMTEWKLAGYPLEKV